MPCPNIRSALALSGRHILLNRDLYAIHYTTCHNINAMGLDDITGCWFLVVPMVSAQIIQPKEGKGVHSQARSVGFSISSVSDVR